MTSQRWLLYLSTENIAHLLHLCPTLSLCLCGLWTPPNSPTRIAAGHGWLSENNYLTSMVLMWKPTCMVFFYPVVLATQGKMVSELAKQLWGFTDLICLSVQSSDTLHKCIKPAKKLRPFSLSVQIRMRFSSVSTSVGWDFIVFRFVLWCWRMCVVFC
jgi:hypothetical protein